MADTTTIFPNKDDYDKLKEDFDKKIEELEIKIKEKGDTK